MIIVVCLLISLFTSLTMIIWHMIYINTVLSTFRSSMTELIKLHIEKDVSIKEDKE